jgi:hypothetical protein
VNDVTVNMGTEESHDTSNMERAGINFRWEEAKQWTKEGGRSTKGGGDVSGSDVVHT